MILNISLFCVSIFIFLSKKNTDNSYIIQNSNKKIDTSALSLINNNQEVKLPEYVPPKDGGDNSFWCGNRHRYILKDRKCYFGNGLKRRYRGGQNWQNQNTN